MASKKKPKRNKQHRVFQELNTCAVCAKKHSEGVPLVACLPARQDDPLRVVCVHIHEPLTGWPLNSVPEKPRSVTTALSPLHFLRRMVYMHFSAPPQGSVSLLPELDTLEACPVACEASDPQEDPQVLGQVTRTATKFLT